MLLQLRRSIVAVVFFVILCGICYPLAETGLGQLFFPHQANGSLIHGGSALIGQRWSGPSWFHGRPGPYDAAASGATNLGPRSKVLKEHVAARIARWHRLGVNPTPELVESSGSGLDPDISPASAYAQVKMVARARHLPASTVRSLVTRSVHAREFGFLGEPYVNVLELNQALAGLR